MNRGCCEAVPCNSTIDPTHPDGELAFYFRRFGVVKKVVGQSYTFNHQIDSGLRRIILLLNEMSKQGIFWVTTGGIRENNRQDLVTNYCKTLDTDFSIFQGTHVNFSHLHNIRELWDGEVIISPGKTQTCGVLVLT